MIVATITRSQSPWEKEKLWRFFVMETADYIVLMMVVVAYLGWIFQGERKYVSQDSAPENQESRI